jgi:hypothetical protein
MDKWMEKFKTLSLPEQLIAAGGVLMLIASIFDWFSYSGFGEGGWGKPGSIWSVLAILISIILAGVIIATRLGNVQMPALPQNLTWGKVWGGGAAAVVVLMLLKAWRIMDVPVGGFGLGFFIGVVAAAMIAYGGFMLYTAEKNSS